MPRTRPPYTPEFRAEAVQLYRSSGRGLKQISPSMGTVGDALDNAVAESFFGTLKRELVHRNSFPTRAAARTALFDYIEVFFNRRRRHSTIGQLSPEEYVRRYAAPFAV